MRLTGAREKVHSCGGVLARESVGKVEGRLLLFVDSADSADTAEILGDVAKLAEPDCGWL